MPNDQWGNPIAVGDTVIIRGEVTKVLSNPNFINCTVKLSQQMPPSGTEVNVQLNTAQVEKQDGAQPPNGGTGKPQEEKPQGEKAEKPQEKAPVSHPPEPPPHTGSKK